MIEIENAMVLGGDYECGWFVPDYNPAPKRIAFCECCGEAIYSNEDFKQVGVYEWIHWDCEEDWEELLEEEGVCV